MPMYKTHIRQNVLSYRVEWKILRHETILFMLLLHTGLDALENKLALDWVFIILHYQFLIRTRNIFQHHAIDHR